MAKNMVANLLAEIITLCVIIFTVFLSNSKAFSRLKQQKIPTFRQNERGIKTLQSTPFSYENTHLIHSLRSLDKVLATALASTDHVCYTAQDWSLHRSSTMLTSTNAVPMDTIYPFIFVIFAAVIAGLLKFGSEKDSSSQAPTTLDNEQLRNTINTGESYVFDNDGIDSDSVRFTPEYLVSGILAGLNILPPERLLRKQTGAGRLIQYQTYRKLNPIWSSIKSIQNNSMSFEHTSTPMKSDIFESMMVADLSRIVNLPGIYQNINLLGSFRIYKFKIHESISKAINKEVASIAIQDMKSMPGIAVTNSGGYHGITDFFENENNNKNIQYLSDCIQDAINKIEHDDFIQSKNIAKEYSMKFKESNINPCNFNEINNLQSETSSSITKSESSLRKLQKAKDSEAWINVSGHGNWNKAHTHSGAVWSGVYYVQSNRDLVSPLKSYSGQLLLQPSPHITQTKHILNDIELDRLNCYRIGDSSILTNDIEAIRALPRPSRCEYVEIIPEAGEMIIFPSWLYHAVVPLSVERTSRANEDSLRISLAFNFANA
eukprot:gene4022-8011_t